MQKISLKASVIAVSLSLALTPLGFAQSTGGTQASVKAQAVADTRPLPGAKVAGQFVEEGTLTPLGVAVIAAAALLSIVIAANASNDDFLAILASNPGLTATTGTR